MMIRIATPNTIEGTMSGSENAARMTVLPGSLLRVSAMAARRPIAVAMIELQTATTMLLRSAFSMPVFAAISP